MAKKSFFKKADDEDEVIVLDQEQLDVKLDEVQAEQKPAIKIDNKNLRKFDKFKTIGEKSND